VTTFVVVAAGRGSRLGRVGDELHKALIPIAGRAVLSRQFDLAPLGARFVVVTGYRADQVRDYITLAHPDLDVTFVHDDGWGAGPGQSLLAAADVVPQEDDVVWTACDTLWEPDDALWESENSWLGVAPIPAGTPAARWCRAVPTDDGRFVARIDDKTPNVAPRSLASVACGYVIADDLELFWTGLAHADRLGGELQFSGGLDALLAAGRPLELRRVRWLDVGDERAYRTALATFGSYDPVKPGQATYVLPDTQRVVKFHANPDKLTRRVERAKQFADGVVPRFVEPSTPNFLAYKYVLGLNGYQVFERYGPANVTLPIIRWWSTYFWDRRVDVQRPANWSDTVMRFYRDKTFRRVMALPQELQDVALDAVTRVDWHALVEGAVPGTFHGDMTYANVLFPTREDHLVALDWREDFAGDLHVGDLRYDLAKLLGGTVFNWENASRGNFEHWRYGPVEADVIRDFATSSLQLDARQLEQLGALCLLNSAPLHAAPMDEILVARGARWLGQVT